METTGCKYFDLQHFPQRKLNQKITSKSANEIKIGFLSVNGALFFFFELGGFFPAIA